MAEVRLENVYKVYRDEKKREVVAAADVNLTIKDQEFVVLVGPSGCGKSTTLRMIAGLEEITKGSIYIDGRKVNDVPPKDRDIAMVFQNYALYPHMTIYNNIAFGLQLRRVPKDEIDRRVRDAAQILGLTDDMLQRKPKQLSGGQRQRVAVGRAIVRKPKAFLFDEPLSNLDAKMRVQMRTELSKLHTRLASTMIYVTHDQVEAMTMGDRIVVMKDGVVQQVAEPLTLYNHPTNMFVAGFIGSPPMNFVHGSLVAEKGGLIFVEEAPAETRLTVEAGMEERLAGYAGKKVVFGIRPEDVQDRLYARESEGGSVFAANLEVVEPMGAETLLYLNTGAHSLVAKSHGYKKIDVNRKIELTADMKKAHFFDATTEQAIV